ncbi:MAG: DUF4176 domain-containing protein [Bacilli bacterium]|nr:DUF4176 domain-containing protein [Bacilli bacterium]
MDLNKYLPLGSIVSLNGKDAKLMIIGYKRKNREINKIFDYSGCMYPTGIFIPSSYSLSFNHDQIDKVYYVGYKDDKYKKLCELLNRIDEKQEEMVDGK